MIMIIMIMIITIIIITLTCISIMWSPSLMVRFRGAAPDKKSFTCNEKTRVSDTVSVHI